MPEKVIPDIETFDEFAKKMTKLGFRKLSSVEFRKEFNRLGLIAPRPIEGRETGFKYYANRILIIVWTTWLAKNQTIRKNDSGWVVIKQDYEKRPVYFAGPFHRTKNFFLRLFQHAWLAHFRAKNRPLCPLCFQFMKIHKGRGIKSRYWSCDRVEYHLDEQIFHRSWDFGLPPKAIEFLKAKRKAKANWLAKMGAEEKEPYAAMKKRKPWIIIRPENLP